MKIVIAGKWFGRMRTNEKFIKIGQFQRQVFSKEVDYVFNMLHTRYGVFGLKMWVQGLNYSEKKKN